MAHRAFGPARGVLGRAWAVSAARGLARHGPAVNHRRASSTATAARRLIEQANTHLQRLRAL
ncbi:hypothetical protein [Oryza sativa Japonica Group]|uniref:Uncharacterized protein n=1 Tax=Oryza sativa subsp. japonica TaxID=39947 RepID=Q5N7E2_ORYSJ|nr:hypothetical protein [Oryza sativa Japonica Group]BAD82614.1 hypothetical protein [Oryza sativa Japonica Group]